MCLSDISLSWRARTQRIKRMEENRRKNWSLVSKIMCDFYYSDQIKPALNWKHRRLGDKTGWKNRVRIWVQATGAAEQTHKKTSRDQERRRSDTCWLTTNYCFFSPEMTSYCSWPPRTLGPICLITDPYNHWFHLPVHRLSTNIILLTSLPFS